LHQSPSMPKAFIIRLHRQLDAAQVGDHDSRPGVIG
jgi:hypothetical protein